jgi:hypothetical protein
MFESSSKDGEISYPLFVSVGTGMRVADGLPVPEVCCWTLDDSFVDPITFW